MVSARYMQPLLLLILLLFISPPANWHFSSFLQNGNWNKALGCQVPRTSWEPRCGRKLLVAIQVSSLFAPQPRGRVSQPASAADHTSWASPEKSKVLPRKLGRRSPQEVPAGVRVALCCSSGLLSRWQLTRGFTAGQPCPAASPRAGACRGAGARRSRGSRGPWSAAGAAPRGS